MENRSYVKCPHCKKSQISSIYDLTEDYSMDGSFEMCCELCGMEFKVEFEYTPFIRESKCMESV